MSPRLEARAARARSRLLVRGWEYRQRNHARGTWFRLRRVLADAKAAWVIEQRDVDRLLAAGLVPERVGAELEPPKTILFVPVDLFDTIDARREIRVRIDADLLAQPCIALLRFE